MRDGARNSVNIMARQLLLCLSLVGPRSYEKEDECQEGHGGCVNGTGLSNKTEGRVREKSRGAIEKFQKNERALFGKLQGRSGLERREIEPH